MSSRRVKVAGKKRKLTRSEKDVKAAAQLREDIRCQLEELRGIIFPDEEEEKYNGPVDEDDDEDDDYSGSGGEGSGNEEEEEEEDEEEVHRRREPTVKPGMVVCNRLFLALTKSFLEFEDAALKVLDEPVAMSAEFDTSSILAGVPQTNED